MRLLPALVIAAALVAAAPAARANLTPVFTGHTGSLYSYTLRFTVDQPGEQLRPGDIVTIYDLGIPTSITSATATPGWAVSLQNEGNTPVPFAPAVNDDANLLNVTYTYTGAPLASSFDFPPVQIETDPDTTGTQFSNALSTTSFLATGDQTSLSITVVPAPAGGNIPEPASLALLSAGATALLTRRRK